jgi:hypothetical protein
MKWHRHLCQSGLLMLLLCDGANAGPMHVALRAEIETRSDTVLLANLLPAQVSPEMRRSAGAISFGSAPKPGTIRRLCRATIVDTLEANGMSATTFDIPECIQVHRAGHELTGEEVWSAIQNSVSSKLNPAIASLKPENIRFNSSIIVPPSGARLKLTEVKYDPLIGEARLRLVSSGDARILPFYVTAKLEPVVAAANKSSEAAGLAPGVVLVSPKRPAILRLHSANSETMLPVQALIPGRLGEVIPVRLLSNRRTLKARVVDFGLLDAAF